MKKIWIAICLILCLGLTGCSYAPGYEQTEATEQALETYYAAVRAAVEQTEGTVTIDAKIEDTVVNKATTVEKYEYVYKVKEESEIFDYRCYDESGTLSAHYAVSDSGAVVNQLTGETANNFAAYQTHSTNPISSLQMFRMDSNYKVRHDIISAITMEESEGKTRIKVSFHGDKLTGSLVLSEGGLNRTVISHERIYTIEEGKITRIEIYDREHAQYQNETGVMNTDTVVEVSY